MALMLATRRAQLNLFLQAMVVEGLVSNEFLQLQSLKETYGRDVVIRTIIGYWSAAKHLFTQMSTQLDTCFVDFYDVLACADNLFERSNSIGAVHVSIACNDIFNGCHENNKDRCTQGLTTAKREFAKLQIKFESVVEFERMIIECEEILERQAQEEMQERRAQDGAQRI